MAMPGWFSRTFFGLNLGFPRISINFSGVMLTVLNLKSGFLTAIWSLGAVSVFFDGLGSGFFAESYLASLSCFFVV
jgi:hypothetical protein